MASRVTLTEEELQEEYQSLLKRIRRIYPHLVFDVPPTGTPSRHLKRLYGILIDQIATEMLKD